MFCLKSYLFLKHFPMTLYGINKIRADFLCVVTCAAIAALKGQFFGTAIKVSFSSKGPQIFFNEVLR